jgi:hypothetical protein
VEWETAEGDIGAWGALCQLKGFANICQGRTTSLIEQTAGDPALSTASGSAYPEKSATQLLAEEMDTLKRDVTITLKNSKNSSLTSR